LTELKIQKETLNKIAQAEKDPVSGQSAPNKFSLEMFELGEKLSPEGMENEDEDEWRYENSYFVKERSSGSAYALRIIDKAKIRGKSGTIFREEVQRQIEILANLQHPNLLRLYGTFEDDTSTYLVLELPEKKDLYKRLKAETRFTEEKAAQYIAQVAAGLQYLHSKHIMHRDLKPEHLRLGTDGQVKMSGFKWAVYAPPPNDWRNKVCGTLEYLSPEILKPSEKSGCYYVSPGLQDPKDNHYTNKIDLWSFGVLTYEFVVGKTPWGDDGPVMTQRRISKGEVTVPSFVSAEAKDLIEKVSTSRNFKCQVANTRELLVLDPDQRLPLEEVQKHPWIIKHQAKKQATMSED
jgi:aurora kinase